MRSVRHRARLHSSRLSAGSFSEGVGYIGTRLTARAANAARRLDSSLANRRRIEEATIEAVKRYEPGPYPGRVDILLPNEVWRHSGDRPDDWKLVAAEVVEHVGHEDLDGDSMLHEPYVRDVAELLNPMLGHEGGDDAASR
jgi:hypothetical protein